jgi:mono/diheme cytochrome c family protein
MNYKVVFKYGLFIALVSTFLIAPQISGWTEEADTSKKVDYKKLKNPMPYTKKSIARGRNFFIRVCAQCHGPDGKAEIDVIADATDLTKPIMYYSGTTDGEIFRSIKEGAGVSMPPYKTEIKKENDMWHLVNFIRSLWPKDQRPQLQEEKKPESEDDSKPGGNDDE